MKRADRRTNTLPWYKLTLWCAAILFTFYSLALSIAEKDGSNILLCLVTFLLVSAPVLLGKLLKFRLSTPIYTFFVLYALGPVLGCIHHLYYLTAWWDDLLHLCGGIVFAMFGFFLADLLNQKRGNTLIMSVVFALCFSIAIAGLWEFYEFGSDQLLGTDMQMDTVVQEFTSYALNDELGEVAAIRNIQEVSINGIPMEFGGYLELGLIDTMKDMLIEALGALVYVVFVLLEKGRHPAFIPLTRTERDC